MTDDQVIEKIAKHAGFIHCNPKKAETNNLFRLRGKGFLLRKDLPAWLISRDALAPVLAGLSGKEKWDLHVALLTQWQTLPISARPPNYTEWLLALPPRDLAHAIAEVTN